VVVVLGYTHAITASLSTFICDLLLRRHRSCRGRIDLEAYLRRCLLELVSRLLSLRTGAEEVEVGIRRVQESGSKIRPRDTRIGESELLGNTIMPTGQAQMRLHRTFSGEHYRRNILVLEALSQEHSCCTYTKGYTKFVK
jgi:hypothetical protein